jgi:DNA-directed RNA polymerase specialized sigma24 family protein
MALLREALPADPRTLSRDQRAAFALLATESGRLPQRDIGVLLGCSHATVGRLLAKANAKADV